MAEKIWIDGMVYHVYARYNTQPQADRQKKMLKDTGTLSSVRVVKDGRFFIVAAKGLTEKGKNIQKHEKEIKGIIKKNLI